MRPPDYRGILTLTQREQLEQRLLLAALHLSHAQDIVQGGTDCRITAKVIEARSVTVSACRWLMRDCHEKRLLTPAMVQALTEEGAR